MELKVVYLWFLLSIVMQCVMAGSIQSAVELPVQLVGFPFIIASVRITNIAKKLSYAFSPATYRSRTRRELTSIAEPFDVHDVENHIVSEYGDNACVFERVCAQYATNALAEPRPQMDFKEIFSQYKRSADIAKELYLLSVFLGDIVGSPQLCHQLGKRRGCDELLLV